jgi:hypothetical protein
MAFCCCWCLFCFWKYWSLSLGVSAKVLYHLSHNSYPFCFRLFSYGLLQFAQDQSWLWLTAFWVARITLCKPPCSGWFCWDGVLQTFSLNCHPPDLCLSSSWEYKYVPQHPTFFNLNFYLLLLALGFELRAACLVLYHLSHCCQSSQVDF